MPTRDVFFEQESIGPSNRKMENPNWDLPSLGSGLSDASSQGKSLDVFVNGQLLISGSESERAAGSRDYAIASGTELKFAFSLETDDVVQLIKR